MNEEQMKLLLKYIDLSIQVVVDGLAGANTTLTLDRRHEIRHKLMESVGFVYKKEMSNDLNPKDTK